MKSLQQVVEKASRELNKSLEEIHTVVPDPNGGGLFWFILFRDMTYAELKLPEPPENWADMVKDIVAGLTQPRGR